MLADDRNGAVVNTRINGLLGCEVEFEASSARARKAIEKDWFRFADESALREHMAWAIVLGASIANTPFVEVDGRWVQELHVWHMRNATYDFVRRGWYVNDANGKRIDIEKNDPEWWVLTPYGKSRPWGKGTWRQTALYWLGKSTGWIDWQHYNEVHGAGILAGKIPEGKSINDPGTIAFWNQLKAIGKRSRIIMPFGYELETIEAMAATWQTFPEAIKHANTAIAIVHLGQNLTTEVDGGSYAATVEHGTVRQDYKRFDAKTLSTSVHDGPLSHWQRFNFGSGEAPWPKWQTEPPEDLKAQAETLNVAGDALAKWTTAGLNVDKVVYAEKFGVELDKTEPLKEPEPPPGTEPQGTPPEETPPADDIDLGLRETVTLASGDTEDVAGFHAGQAYADKLSAASRDAGAAALNPEIDALMSIIESLDDTPEWPIALKQRLLERYGKLDIGEFAGVVEKALVLAELAGRYAVQVDAQDDVAELTERIVELAGFDGNDEEIIALARKAAAARVYQKGPRGGTYYLTPSGKKVYGKPRQGDTVKGSDGSGSGDAGATSAAKPLSTKEVQTAKDKLKAAPTENFEKLFKQRTDLPKDYLESVNKATSADHEEALQQWSETGYTGIRASYYRKDSLYAKHAAEKGDYPPKEWHKKSAKVIEGFLKSAPKVEGEVYRGEFMRQSDLARIINKGQFEMRGPTSTSRAFAQSLNFAGLSLKEPKGAHVVFSVKSKSGVDISQHSSIPQEREVLMPHGTKFKITGLRKTTHPNGRTIVIVEGHEI
jgi:phage gp29-like protein